MDIFHHITNCKHVSNSSEFMQAACVFKVKYVHESLFQDLGLRW